jgi:cation transport ATPase
MLKVMMMKAKAWRTTRRGVCCLTIPIAMKIEKTSASGVLGCWIGAVAGSVSVILVHWKGLRKWRWKKMMMVSR